MILETAFSFMGWLLLLAMVLVPVGLAWWLLLHVRQRDAEVARRSVLQTVAVFFCYALLLCVALAALIVGLFAGGVPGVIIAVVITAAVVRHRRSEMRYLVWNLAAAAERGIPLESVALAYAHERAGGLANRARKLADYLDAAMPLSLALSRSWLSVSPDVQLAAAMGEKTGSLGQSLRKALEQLEEFERLHGATLVRFFYLTWILWAAVLVLSFVMLKIIPVFEEMFVEFGLRLPAVTQVLIAVSRLATDYGFILLPLLLLLTLAGVLSLFGYVGLPFRGLPIVSRWFSTINNASLLRLLSVAVNEKRPLVGTLELLAAYAPSAMSRSRLHLAVRLAGDGSHWSDALQRARLVTRSQATVFRAAERAGNLAWALNEMADSSLRRVAHRAQAASNILFPLLILLFGVGVMFVAAGLMMPLFSLISALA